VLQVKPQTPLVQVAVALAGGGQPWPQVPQLIGSLPRFVQVPLQQVWPLAQQVWVPAALVQHAWVLGQQTPPQAV